MDNMNIDKQKLINAILNANGGKINKNAVSKAASGDASGVLANLDGDSKKKIEAALSDKNKLKNILDSKEAKEILKNLSGGKKNG